MLQVAIIGATGYTGSELVRILSHHPYTNIALITSESRSGERFSDVHPSFEGICDIKLQMAAEIYKTHLDIVFLAVPHRVSMGYVQKWQNHKFKIIDLSGDYRLSSADVYQKWYDKEHLTPDLVPDVVYGLPEIDSNAISSQKIVANPGCYPTASILALAPLLANGIVDTKSIIIDAKSGITGAGVKSSATTHYSNVNENFKAYALKTHRHTIEIEEQLGELSESDLKVQFTPHLLPIDRGILTTCYATPQKTVTEKGLQKLYTSYYQSKPFVRVRQQAPEIKHIRGTNLCDVFVTYDERTNRIIALSAIDNLVKGAAGQAVQNMNIMSDLPQTAGLLSIPLNP
jgi:N-acetyl-gamma-glutamyl-phosphate reductase